MMYRLQHLSVGCLPIHTRYARGGGNPDSALDPVLSKLRATGATVGWLICSARPLCTERRRVFIFVSHMQSVDASDLAEEAKRLAAHMAKMPHHTLESFLLDDSSAEQKPDSVSVEVSTVGEADEMSKYHAAYSKALQKAVKRKRLSKDASSLPMASRVSESVSALRCKSTWLKAQADCWQLIGMTGMGIQDRGLTATC